MGFKIGDRVRFKPEYSHPGCDVGTVTAVGGLDGVDLWAEIAFDGVDDKGEWMMWALELAGPAVAPRGPKPLTLTSRSGDAERRRVDLPCRSSAGGTRFTVRNGRSNRAPAWIAAKWNLRQRPVRVEIPLPMEMPWSTQP